MPKLSVWLVRASLIYMGLGFLFGAMILYHKGIPLYAWTWRLLNPHIEIMIYGWTIQFVMGIAFWALPRFPGEARFGRSYLGWWSFGLINAGIVLASLDPWYMTGTFATIGRVLILGAVIAFAVMMWPRVKPLSIYSVSQDR
jgi:hypothetical protein